jgi:hypothetical protein
MVDPCNNPTTVVEMMKICTPDQIRVVSKLAASIWKLHLRLSFARPEIVFLKNLCDVTDTDYTEMVIFREQSYRMHFLKSRYIGPPANWITVS